MSEDKAIAVRPPAGIRLAEAQVTELDAVTPPGMVKQRQGPSGLRLDYLEGWYVEDVLDRVFGKAWTFTWEFALDPAVSLKCKEVVVKGRLAVTLPDGAVIVKEDTGGDAVEFLRDSDVPVSLTNNIKAAVTDALKRCARQFGIGRDLVRAASAKRGNTKPATPAKPGPIFTEVVGGQAAPASTERPGDAREPAAPPATARPPAADGTRYITAKQAGYLHARRKAAGMTELVLKDYLVVNAVELGIDAARPDLTAQIRARDFDRVLKWVEGTGVPADDGIGRGEGDGDD